MKKKHIKSDFKPLLTNLITVKSVRLWVNSGSRKTGSSVGGFFSGSALAAFLWRALRVDTVVWSISFFHFALGILAIVTADSSDFASASRFVGERTLRKSTCSAFFAWNQENGFEKEKKRIEFYYLDYFFFVSFGDDFRFDCLSAEVFLFSVDASIIFLTHRFRLNSSFERFIAKIFLIRCFRANSVLSDYFSVWEKATTLIAILTLIKSFQSNENNQTNVKDFISFFIVINGGNVGYSPIFLTSLSRKSFCSALCAFLSSSVIDLVRTFVDRTCL